MTKEVREIIIELLTQYNSINSWTKAATDGNLDQIEESDRGKTSDGLFYSKSKVRQYLEEHNSPITPKNVELVAKKLASEAGNEVKEIKEIETEIDSFSDEELSVYMNAKLINILSGIRYELMRQDYMEYTVVVIPDLPSGEIDNLKLSEELGIKSKEGYRLKVAFTNELGTNIGGVGVGPVKVGLNASMDQTVLIFERPCSLDSNKISIDKKRINDMEQLSYQK